MLTSAFATARAAIAALAPLTWLVAIGGIWLLPLRAVVVVTGVSMAGSTVRAAKATSDHDLASLVRLVADLSRDEELRPQLRRLP